MKITIFLLCGCAWVASGFAESETLTLERALELARQNSPALSAARLNTRSAQQAVSAAGLWRNPDLEFEAEGIGGDLEGFNDAEYTVGVSQKFQRNAKRRSERAVAQKAIATAFAAEAEKERALMAEVRRSFVDVLAQQETAKVQADQLELGHAFVEVAKRRYQAGGGSELEFVQAELILEEIVLSQACCFGELEAALDKLASLIGLPRDELKKVEGSFYELEKIDGVALDESHPALQRLNAEIEKMRAEAERAGLQDAQDITLGAGFRHEAAGNINSFVLGASMPLNFIRKGRAEQAAVLAEIEALKAERAEVRRRLLAALDGACALYGGVVRQVELAKNNLMPKAVKAYELSRAGYEAGRFSWYELIAAQQRLADIRIGYIESLKEAHVLRAEISKFANEGI